jgi:hypothetical protein
VAPWTQAVEVRVGARVVVILLGVDSVAEGETSEEFLAWAVVDGVLAEVRSGLAGEAGEDTAADSKVVPRSGAALPYTLAFGDAVEATETRRDR